MSRNILKKVAVESNDQRFKSKCHEIIQIKIKRKTKLHIFDLLIYSSKGMKSSYLKFVKLGDSD